MRRGLPFVATFFLIGLAPDLWALSCPEPTEGLEAGTALCDCALAVDPSCDAEANYIGGKVCLVEPVAGQNIAGGDLCILGKLREYRDVESLIELVIAVSYPDDPNSVHDFVEQITWDEIDPTDGSFRIPSGAGGPEPDLAREGVFQVILHASFRGDETQPVTEIAPHVREVTRIGRPDFTLASIEATSAGNPLYPVVASTEPLPDGGRGPDRHLRAEITGPIATNKANLCLKAASETSSAGSDLTFTVTNRITDTAERFLGNPQFRKTIVNETIQTTAEAPRESSGSCANGHIVNVPLGHGENQLTIEVDNALTTSARGNVIEVDPIRNDIKGPNLCVRYYEAMAENAEGVLTLQRQIQNMDGLSLTRRLPYVIVDVTVCGEEPDELPVPRRWRSRWFRTLCADQDPVCIQKNNETLGGEARFRPMTQRTDANGTVHYVYHLDSLRFPINTFTIKARDLLGNITEEGHSFGYGQIRSLASGAGGTLAPQVAATPNAVSLFLPSSYVTGEMKTLLLRVLNSDKMKGELPKMMIPKILSPEEIETLREDSGCDDAYSEEYLRAIQLYPEDPDEPAFYESIEIRRLQLLTGNRIKLTVAVNDLRGKGEIFTINTSENGDLFDDFFIEGTDGDHDGQPNFEFPDEGLPISNDFPGEILPDPVLQSTSEPGKIIPIRLTTTELIVDLLITFSRVNNRLVISVTNATAETPAVGLVGNEAGFAVELDCDRSEALTHFNGEPGRLIGREACESAAWFNERENSLGLNESCLNQSLDQQVQFILEELVLFQLPRELRNRLEELRNEPVGEAARISIMGNEAAMETFSDIAAGEITINPIGIFAKLPILIAPAGLVEEGVTPSGPSPSAANFIRERVRQLLPGVPLSVLSNQLGPLRNWDSENPTDPATEASYLGGELNLALSEEFINSLLFSSNLLMSDLSTSVPDFMDISVSKIRELGLATPSIGGSDCLDEDQVNVDPPIPPPTEEDPDPVDPDPTPTDDWRCFPFPLDIGTMIGAGAQGGESVIPGIPTDSPVVIRTKLSPLAPATVRIVDLSPSAVGGGDSSRPSTITAEVEIGLRDAEMWIYKGAFGQPIDQDGDGSVWDDAWDLPVETEDWCRYQPGVNPGCRVPNHNPLPIMRLKTNGRLFLKLTFDLASDGRLSLRGGLFGTFSGPEVVLDKERSYLNVSMVQNNTMIRDTDDLSTGSKGMVSTFKGNMNTILGDYVANSSRSISFDIPLMAPISQYCARYPGDPNLCQEGSSLDDLWEDLDLQQFGIHGLEVEDLVLESTGADPEEETDEDFPSSFGSPRYLELGTGLCFKNRRGRCIR